MMKIKDLIAILANLDENSCVYFKTEGFNVGLSEDQLEYSEDGLIIDIREIISEEDSFNKMLDAADNW